MRSLAEAVEQERYGRIQCERRFYDNMNDALRAELFSRIAVMELKLEWTRGTIEIAGASPMFDVVPPPAEVPLYNAIVHQDAAGGYRVEFVKPLAYSNYRYLLEHGRVLPR